MPLSPQDHVRGDPIATLTLIEYGDYQCPHCVAAEPVIVDILRRRPAGLCQAFRHFPLEAIHPMAKLAAETAEWAASMGAFWAMHSALLENSRELSIPMFLVLAGRLDLSPDRLRDALSLGTFAAKVEHDFALGVLSGVNGTPTLFINGGRYVGSMTPGALDVALGQAQ